mgnify:CR=1 FL=1
MINQKEEISSEKYNFENINSIEEFQKNDIEYRMLIMPDHPTPLSIRTHTSDPVPYMIYDSTNKVLSGLSYNEKDALKSGNYIKEGYKTIQKLIG